MIQNVSIVPFDGGYRELLKLWKTKAGIWGDYCNVPQLVATPELKNASATCQLHSLR